jgi:starch synthase
MVRSLNVLFLAAEAEPYVKVGGLGDVAGSLPKALRALPRHSAGGGAPDVRTVIPLQPGVNRSDLRRIAAYSLERSGTHVDVEVFESRTPSSLVYFIDGAPVHASQEVYSADPEIDAEKYVFYSLAALELPKQLGWAPDILHVNDWHSGIAAFVARLNRWAPAGRVIPSVLTVHNLAFLGPDVVSVLHAYGVPMAKTDLPRWSARRALPLGLWSADAIVAVSQAYAAEIQTREYGARLDRFLRRRSDRLHGFLNGIDTVAFDPEHDDVLSANYSMQSLERRAGNKAALQRRLGLARSLDTPLLATVSRMDSQKGMDLVLRSLKSSRMATQEWQAIILGRGNSRLEKAALQLQRGDRKRIRVANRYDPVLARQIYAGADILLMPSRYEPCGLSQMIAMRYGCVPVVRAVGGLRETVRHGENGFVFRDPTSTALSKAVKAALVRYRSAADWRELQLAGMAADFSWESSARRYLALYRSLTRTASGK